MRSFYHFLMTFRNEKRSDDESMLADWAFHEHDFPKHSADYNEISNYLEWNTPFVNALTVFDELWSGFLNDRDHH